MASPQATPITVLSLVTGVGGIELGLRLTGLRTRLVCAVERDPYAAAVLLARMEDETLEPAPVWCGNLQDFDARPFAGVGLVCAGYPCPGQSAAGKRLGQRDPRWLWPEVARVVSECRPAYVFLENVGGHLRLAFDDVWSDLGVLGYRREAGLFSAEEVGATHGRERLFILAHADGERLRVRTRAPDGAEGSGTGKAPQRERVRTHVGAAGQDVADGDGTGLGEQRWSVSGGEELTASEPLGGTLADAEGSGRYPSGFSGECRTLPRPALHDRALADAEGIGSGEPHDEECSELRQRAWVDAGWGSLGAFPPDRLDFETWARVLTRVPSAQPALCRLAERVPARLDELRCLGNAVVPLVAAHAFTTLARRLGVAAELGLVTP